MKSRPSKRVIWLVVPVLPLLVMGVGMWVAGKADSDAIATRGAKAPPEKKFSLVNPRSWGVYAEWLDEGMDALEDWDYYPWKEERQPGNQFGQRLSELDKSDRPEDKAEVARLEKLGREWYERILARYPDLAMREEKEIPPGENGLLQWQRFLKHAGDHTDGKLFGTVMPTALSKHLREGGEPDLAEVKAWLDANRSRIEEIRAIALLPGRSAAGMTDRERMMGGVEWTRHAAEALLLDARSALADGDTPRALESIRAVNGLADHLSGTAALTLSSSIRSNMQNYVLRELAPSAGRANLTALQAALDPKLREPSEMADALRANWNLWVPNHLLPVLADSADPDTPRDGDYLAETYTRQIVAQIQQAEGMSLRDYAVADKVETSVDQLSKRSRDLELVNGWDPRATFLHYQEATGLTQAAFAIMNGQPVPLDPVYGLPYKWDPEKRELGLPDPPHRPEYRPKPVKVPKL